MSKSRFVPLINRNELNWTEHSLRHANWANWTRSPTQVYDGDGHGWTSGRVEAFPQKPARATGPWSMAHPCRHSTGLYPFSPCICATSSARACFPVLQNARHTCPTQLCPPNHAPTFNCGALQLSQRCTRPRTSNYYIPAWEWNAPSRDSLRWSYCPVISPIALAILRRILSPCMWKLARKNTSPLSESAAKSFSTKELRPTPNDRRRKNFRVL